MEASTSVKIIAKIEQLVMCLATMAYVCGACVGCVAILVLAVNSDQFQILQSPML